MPAKAVGQRMVIFMLVHLMTMATKTGFARQGNGTVVLMVIRKESIHWFMNLIIMLCTPVKDPARAMVIFTIAGQIPTATRMEFVNTANGQNLGKGHKNMLLPWRLT